MQCAVLFLWSVLLTYGSRGQTGWLSTVLADGFNGRLRPYQQYFYTRLANFAQAVVVLLIFSLLFMVVFFILAAVRDKIKDLVVAERALFAFALLCFAFYCIGCFD